MKASLALRLMARESRGLGGRAVFFLACLAIGVAAVVAVAGLTDALDAGIRSEARPLIAADLSIAGLRPLPAGAEALIATFPGVERAVVKEMATIVAAESGRSQLVELKVVSGGYPFYGRLEYEPPGPAGLLAGELGADGAAAAPELVQRLGLTRGDRIRVGTALFTIRQLVRSEPDRVNVSFALGPRIFLSAEGLARTGLEAFGSRIEQKTLLMFPDGSTRETVDEAAAKLREAIAEEQGFEVQSFADAQPALRTGLDRAGKFLGLVALLSLLIGGVGVAQTVRSWLAGRMDAIATLKCLGATPGDILFLYLGQTILMGLAGSAAGALIGTGLVAAAPLFLSTILPNAPVDPVQPWAIARGLALGVGVAALFCLPPLLAARRVPPLRVLRRDAEPIPAPRLAGLVTLLATGLGVWSTAWAQSGSVWMAGGFVGGLAVVLAVLALAAGIVSFLAARLSAALARRRARPWVRHGLAALARPGAGTRGGIVAIGLGVLVVLTLTLVQGRLSRQMRADLPDRAPNAFLVDIQPSQWDAVRAILEQRGATQVESVPVVNARLLAVDGKPVEQIASGEGDEGRRRWVLTREQKLTYLPVLPEGSRVIEGSLWDDPGRGEISVEKDFAKDLGAGIGTTLTFDVQGVPVETVVTSLREVDWKSFRINFFLVVEPGLLEFAPQARVAAARLPEGGDQAIQDAISAAAPNVTLLRLREIVDKIVAILDRVSLAIRLLGSFAALAGVAILAGAVSAGAVRRTREVALLKTLGVTRGGVAAMFCLEYALTGFVAAAIGSAGAGVLSWVVLTRGLEIPWEFSPIPYIAALAGTSLLACLSGLSASARALAVRPIEVLRAE